jgi:hypothetical protein
MKGTGIKHFAVNIVQIHCHSLHYDKNSSLLIILIMDTKEVQSWNWEGYSTIAIAGSHIDSEGVIVKASDVYSDAHSTFVRA